MIYEYKCFECNLIWEHIRPMSECNASSTCSNCGKEGDRILSAVPSWFNRTHPDVKQPMDELIAGVPGNIEEI